MRIKVFEFNLYYAGANDITEAINKFCEKHIVTDIIVNRADVGSKTDSLFYTIIYEG